MIKKAEEIIGRIVDKSKRTLLQKIIVFGKSVLSINKEEREIRKAIEKKGLEQFLKDNKN